MSVRCGNRKAHGDGHHHETVAQVRLCFHHNGIMSIEEEAEFERPWNTVDTVSDATRADLDRLFEEFLREGLDPESAAESAAEIYGEDERERRHRESL